MATTKAISGNAIRNNGATIVLGGNISSTSFVTNAPSTSIYASSVKPGKSLVKEVTGTTKALSGGTFAHFTAGRFVILGNTTHLANVVNTVFKLGGHFQLRSIHVRESIVSVLRVTAGWNYVTGAFLSGPTVQTDTMESIDNSTNIDQAARPTRAVPGELVYMTGGKNPKLDDYKARTS